DTLALPSGSADSFPCGRRLRRASDASPAASQGLTLTSVPDPLRGTRLDHAIAPLAAAHPGCSGIHALPEPREAFAARAILAAAADRTPAVQDSLRHGE